MPEDLQKQIDEQRGEIEDLKKKLVEQEHRPTKVIHNLLRSFTGDEPKESKVAALYATADLAVKWFLRRSVIVGSVGVVGGLLALGTLYVTWSQTQQLSEQTKSMVNQTESMAEQNQHMVQQNEYMRSQMIGQQRSTNAEILNNLLSEIEATAKTAERDSRDKWQPSNLLAHRIYRASLAFEPFGDDSLSSERGQLLQAMVADNMIVPKSPRPNFSNADLQDANLSDADLQGANLRGANLRHADLDSADLSDADLQGADLYRAELHSADLQGADLVSADLYRADLSNADLETAKLIGADLLYADLGSADLRDADLRDADLSGGYLRHTFLYDANLRGTDLRGAEGLTLGQLFSARWLFNAKGIDDSLLNIIEDERPELLGDTLPAPL